MERGSSLSTPPPSWNAATPSTASSTSLTPAGHRSDGRTTTATTTPTNEGWCGISGGLPPPLSCSLTNTATIDSSSSTQGLPAMMTRMPYAEDGTESSASCTKTFFKQDTGMYGFDSPTTPSWGSRPSLGAASGVGSAPPPSSTLFRPPSNHRSTSSTGLMRGGGDGRSALTQQMEEDNDVLITAILGSVRRTRSLAEEMGEEIQWQNRFLEELQHVMSRAAASMGRTMRRLKRTAGMSQFTHIWVLFLFIGVVMFFVYVLLKSR